LQKETYHLIDPANRSHPILHKSPTNSTSNYMCKSHMGKKPQGSGKRAPQMHHSFLKEPYRFMEIERAVQVCGNRWSHVSHTLLHTLQHTLQHPLCTAAYLTCSNIYLCVCIFTYMYIYVYICMCVYIYILVYICIHI